ncbi:MAG: heme o synthase [Pseudomonadota bacterium]
MSETNANIQTYEPGFGDFFALMKPRVMSLVVFTALIGMLVAPVSVHPVEGLAAILFIAVGAGASGALNMWWDADIDAVMKRTANRPVPSGRLAPEDALAVGLALSGLSVTMLWLATNAAAAGLLAFTIFFYIAIYTIWLKRSTPQNIVIGGAAGAFPPMVGWVAATGNLALEPVLMFALIFLWTPPHFWALALFMKSDYHEADVPMLTVTHGRKSTRAHILAYSIALAALSGATALSALGGPVYVVAALILNMRLIYGSVVIWRRSETDAEEDGYRAEKRFFRFTLTYLFLLFTAFLVDEGLARMGIF